MKYPRTPTPRAGRSPRPHVPSAVLAGLAILSSTGIVEAAEPRPYQLPDLSGPAFECAWLKAAQLARQPSANGTGYDVVLYAQPGAEHQGNPAGMVGGEPGSTIAFVGDIVLLPCPNTDGPAPIRISGRALKFKLDPDGRLTHVGGDGTVTQGAKKVTLRSAAPAAPKKAP